MSFKPGALAVIVKCPSQPLNIGVIVTLVSREWDGPWLCEGNVKPAPNGKPYGSEVPFKFTRVPQSYLRVLGDGEGEDETFTFAGKPASKEVPHVA